MPLAAGTLNNCFRKLLERITRREYERLMILHYVADDTYKLVTVDEGRKAYHWDQEHEVRLVVDLMRGEIGQLGLAHQESFLKGGA